MGEPKINWIDVPTWDRAAHYEIFRSIPQPQYCVTFELDITQFLPWIKEKGYSFTFSMIYAVTRCANQVEAFRCRFVDGKPAVLDRINTSFTYLVPDTELFKVVNVDMQDTLQEYVALAAETVRNQKEYFTGPCLFWLVPVSSKNASCGNLDFGFGKQISFTVPCARPFLINLFRNLLKIFYGFH